MQAQRSKILPNKQTTDKQNPIVIQDSGSEMDETDYDVIITEVPEETNMEVESSNKPLNSVDIIPSMDQTEEHKSEEEPNKIEIRPPNYPTRLKGVQGFTNDLLQTHFCTLLVGRPDSGKSHLTYEFLNNPQMYFQKFHRVIFVTATQKIGGIVMAKEQYWHQQFDPEKLKQEFARFDRDVLMRYPTQQEFEKRYGTTTDPFNVLVVLDDVVGDIRRYQFDPIVKNLFYNRRHLINRGCVSILFTTQYYVDVPRSFRSNLTSLIVFNCNNLDWQRIKNECIAGTEALPSETESAIAEIFSTKKAFLYINIENSKLYHRFEEQLETVEKTGDYSKKKIKLN